MSTVSPAPADPPTTQPVVRRSMGTWRSLVISMAALGLIVAGWLALVPRVEKVEQPAVDVATTTAQVARDTRTPLWVAPAGGDWTPTSVRIDEPKDGVKLLHAGYHRGAERQQYVSVTQTLAPTTVAAARAWVGEQYRAGGGTLTAGGRVWTRATQLSPQRNVLIGPSGANPVVVLVGTVSHEELAAFVNSLRPVGAGQAASGSTGSPGSGSGSASG